MTSIWDPIEIGAIKLEHRLAMAPMTRSRADEHGVLGALNAEYYAQRASMGLVMTEGTQPSEDGQGYILTPGIHTDAQIAGWREVADAVHDGGGHLVIQLMHTGRVAHPENTPHGRQPVAPSSVAAAGKMFTVDGMQPMPEPRELTADEVRATVEDFRAAARAAISAGADGVEVHGANGYLVHQFLSSNANRRTDEYGGTIADRIRFAVEVVAAVADEIGPARTGIHQTPGNPFNDVREDDTRALYLALLEALAPLDIAYVQVVHGGDEELIRAMREAWPHGFVLNRADADLETRLDDVESGLADVTSIGRMALANPDLVERIRIGAPLNEPDPGTFYGGDEHGYTDYPALATLGATS